MTKKSKPLNLDKFDALDWDEEDAEGSNLAHILEHDIDDVAVENVLDDNWISVEMVVNTAEFAIVGPDRRWDRMLTLLFDTRHTSRVTGCVRVPDGSRSPRSYLSGNG